MRRNGNGGKSGHGEGGSVPRWVRTLFDQHEARMAEMGRAHEDHVEQMAEMKAEHEERMAESERKAEELERLVKVVRLEGLETHRQTREVVRLVGFMEKALLRVHARVERLERE